MHGNLGYLFAAFAITWVAIAAYLLYLGQQVKALRDEMEMTSSDDAANTTASAPNYNL
jgi:CcmD family protein